MVLAAVSLLLLALATHASSKAVHGRRAGNTQIISVSYTNKSTAGIFGTPGDTSIINAGVQVTLSGRGTHRVKGHLQNAGLLLFTQTDSDTYSRDPPVPPPGMAVVWDPDINLINTGVILFDDPSANSTRSTYLMQIASFQNAAGARIQMCGRGDLSNGMVVRLFNKEPSVNDGLLVFDQTLGNLSVSTDWRSENFASTQTLTNNGGVLLRRVRLTLSQNIQGNGCYMIGERSNLYLNSGVSILLNTNGSPVLTGQSISFLGRSGVLHMDEGVYSTPSTSNFGATIYGFGQGNGFEFRQTIVSFSYSNSTLQVNFGARFVNINIGPGYSNNLFSIGPSPFISTLNAILYSGEPPAADPPTQCLLTAPSCAPIIINPSSSPLTTSADHYTSTSTIDLSTSPSVSVTMTIMSDPVVDSTTAFAALSTSTATSVGTSYVSDLTTVTDSLPSDVMSSTSAPDVSDASTTATVGLPLTTDDVDVLAPSTSSTTAMTSTIPSDVPSVSQSAATATASASEPSLPSLACYRDEAESGAPRTLNGPRYTSNDGMTNEACAAFCTRQGFAFSGTEYGIECYCGSVLPSTGPATCQKPCSGDSQSICGGDWALSVSTNQDILDARTNGLPASPAYTELGCFADSVNLRVFSSFSYKNDSMTPALCAAKCSSLSFAFSGTEFGNECYCSDTAPVTTSNQCVKVCAGNAGLICGGPDALTVYQDSALPASITPTCPGLPAGYVFCTEGQKVSGGKCVPA